MIADISCGPGFIGRRLAATHQFARVYGVDWSVPMLRRALAARDPALPLLRAKRLDGFFAHVFGGDAFEKKKPDPLPLLRTCEALGTAPARTLMVGDSRNDAEAARGAGCPVVLVTHGYNHGEPVRSVDADGFVDSLVELTANSRA